jgi:2,3-dimethylmalate lyase
MSAGKRLRELLARPKGVLSTGIYDCLSARIAEQAGYEHAAISGNGLGASLLGFPDIGLSTLTEVAGQARHIAASVDIPLIADADNGYGNALSVMRTVREFEDAGIAGIQLEDQVSPKKSSTVGAPVLVSPEEFAVKIQAACEARRDKDFVIVARTDARLVEGLDSAVDRMLRYIDAGADAAFYSSLQSEDDMRIVVKATPRPVKLNVIEGYPVSQLPCDALFDIGFKIVGYSGLMQRAAMKAMVDILEVFERERTTEGSVRDMAMKPGDRNKVLKVQMYKELEQRLLGESKLH